MTKRNVRKKIYAEYVCVFFSILELNKLKEIKYSYVYKYFVYYIKVNLNYTYRNLDMCIFPCVKSNAKTACSCLFV